MLVWLSSFNWTSCLVSGSDPDEEFPVCELTAGGGTEEHKSEPSASLNPLLHFLLHDASNIFQCQHDYTKTADCERLKPSSLIQRNLCVRKRRLEDRNSPRTKSNQHVCPVQELPPAGVILDLLRSTFPQLTGGFDVFTVGSNRKLKLTPEEIQRSIRSTGKGRSALYIRDKVHQVIHVSSWTEHFCQDPTDLFNSIKPDPVSSSDRSDSLWIWNLTKLLNNSLNSLVDTRHLNTWRLVFHLHALVN